MTTTETRPLSKTRRRWVIPTVMAGVVLAAAVAGVVWFFSGDAPPEVDLSETASAVAGNETSNSASGDIGGTWVVDTSVGTFTVEEAATATFVGFRVEEVLSSVGSTTAVGRTPAIEGTVSIDGTTLTGVEITADMTVIVSDESRRDDNIQDALQTSVNPTATFALTEPIDLGSGAAEGEVVTVPAAGELTINGVTNEIEIPIEAQLVDGRILIIGSTEIVFADYDVEAPSAPVVVSVEDHGVLEIQLWLSR